MVGGVTLFCLTFPVVLKGGRDHFGVGLRPVGSAEAMLLLYEDLPGEGAMLRSSFIASSKLGGGETAASDSGGLFWS